MSQNFPNEYQIPTNYLSGNSTSVYEARQSIEAVYGNNNDRINEALNENIDQSINQTIEKLYLIGSEIEALREKELNLLDVQSDRHITDISIFIKDISKTLFNRNSPRLSNKEIARRSLIAKEGEVGAAVFGLKSDNTQRHEFFFEEVDKNGFGHWFFYSETNIKNTELYNKNILHYEVQPSGVFQVGYGYIEGDELSKFKLATEMYKKLIYREIYSDESKKQTNNKKGLNISKKVISKLIKFPNKNQ